MKLLLLALSEAILFNINCTVKIYEFSDSLGPHILRVRGVLSFLSVCSKLSHSVVNTY